MDFVQVIKTKYPHLDESTAITIVDKAKMFYYLHKYPTLPNITEEEYPIKSFVDKQWILSACEDIIGRLGFNNAIGYKENGISWTFDGAEISDRLLEELTPISGVL